MYTLLFTTVMIDAAGQILTDKIEIFVSDIIRLPFINVTVRVIPRRLYAFQLSLPSGSVKKNSVSFVMELHRVIVFTKHHQV